MAPFVPKWVRGSSVANTSSMPLRLSLVLRTGMAVNEVSFSMMTVTAGTRKAAKSATFKVPQASSEQGRNTASQRLERDDLRATSILLLRGRAVLDGLPAWLSKVCTSTGLSCGGWGRATYDPARGGWNVAEGGGGMGVVGLRAVVDSSAAAQVSRG